MTRTFRGVGVEAYQVDYRAGRTTCYLPEGKTMDLGFELPELPIAEAFDASALRSAIKGAQQGRLMYPEFKRLSRVAGCVGSTLWIADRHVSYFGRKGEVHVEHFPADPHGLSGPARTSMPQRVL